MRYTRARNLISIVFLIAYSIKIFADDASLQIEGYIVEETRKNKLFLWRSELVLTPTSFTYEADFLNNETSEKVAWEKYKLGEASSGSYEYKRYNTDEFGMIRWTGNNISMTVNKNGKIKTKSKRIDGELVVGPSLFLYINKHLESLKAGKKHLVHLAVTELATTIKFQIKIDDYFSSEDEFVVKLRPVNPIYRMFSEKTLFYYRAGEAIPYRTDMLMLPQVKSGNTHKHVYGSLIIEQHISGEATTIMTSAYDLKTPVKVK